MRHLTKDELDAMDKAFWKSVETVDEGCEECKQSQKIVTDEELLTALSNLYTKLVQSQTELDQDAKRILYSNLERLYLR